MMLDIAPGALRYNSGSLLLGAICIAVSIISYLILAISPSKSRKALRSEHLREAFNAIEKRVTYTVKPEIKLNDVASSEHMEVKELFIYPIKSLRGISVPHAMLTNEGFYLDRRFMLLKANPEKPEGWENMHISHFASMALFHPSIKDGKLLVGYRSPGKQECEGEVLELDLEPNITGLRPVEVNMHSSPTTGFDMGEKANNWFSERFGFEVVLAFWGGNTRTVLGNLPGKPATYTPTPPTIFTRLLSRVPLLSHLVKESENTKIAFNDCAPYLVINSSSIKDVSARLPQGMEMDHTKFRSNIVVSSPGLKAWEEDLWATLEFPGLGKEAKIVLTANCGRCPSLNVDYNTGKPGEGEEGKVLKLLQRDRRVDKGAKYSPIFGRYGFVAEGGEGVVVRVGDEVRVGERNGVGSTFYWPGLSTKP